MAFDEILPGARKCLKWKKNDEENSYECMYEERGELYVWAIDEKRNYKLFSPTPPPSYLLREHNDNEEEDDDGNGSWNMWAENEIHFRYFLKVFRFTSHLIDWQALELENYLWWSKKRARRRSWGVEKMARFFVLPHQHHRQCLEIDREGEGGRLLPMTVGKTY